jgi:hypothetical protein
LAHQKEATKRADSIVIKDNAGVDTTADRQELKQYVAAHMNTRVTVALKASYERAYQTADAAANPASNGQVYSQAQAACASKANSIVQAQCVQSYIASHTQPAANPQSVTKPRLSDYVTTYRAPFWTLDATGLSLLIAVGAAVWAVILWSRHS